MKITAIRHGKTDVNADGLIQGQKTDFPLNDNGREQARQATEKLPGDIDIIVSSPLLRARQTVRIINEHFEKETMLVDNRLIEHDFGEFEGVSMNFCVDIEELPIDTFTIMREDAKVLAEIGISSSD